MNFTPGKILSKSFKYTPSHETDIRKTFAKFANVEDFAPASVMMQSTKGINNVIHSTRAIVWRTRSLP